MIAQKLDDVLDWCAEFAVPAITFWLFSIDNLARPVEQVSGILAAIEAKIGTLADHPEIYRRRVRVRAMGKLELPPASLVAAIRAACDATAIYQGIILTIAVAYGGRDEIEDAVRALLAEQAERGLSAADTYLRRNPIPADQLGTVISTVHQALAGLGKPVAEAAV